MEWIKQHFPNAHPICRLHLLVPLLILACWSFANVSRAESPMNLLDGMSFVGENGEIGKPLAEYEDETIVFENGMFTSVSCEPYSFSSAPYSSMLVDGKIIFDAVTKSPTHGTITWHGVVEDEEVNVTFVWTKERWYWDIRREYWFKGKLKK